MKRVLEHKGHKGHEGNTKDTTLWPLCFLRALCAPFYQSHALC
jgi:hypothetical protein